VPRYTSYPTAPHFRSKVKADAYRQWLTELDPGLPLSLYVHIPFCDSLCWFCGCHTKIVRRHAPIGAYLEVLLEEIELVADLLGQRREVSHLHLGGGTPTILEPNEFQRLFDVLRRRFAFRSDAEIAVESDPRGLDLNLVEAMAEAGVNRASLGLQDLNPQVQRAVNRLQSFDETERAVAALRAAGISSINIDLMYGLPHQTVTRVLATIEAVLTLEPERVCLFGYAHVPWMKSHQRLIDEPALPGPAERLAQYLAGAQRLQEAGYVWIGLDHFALPNDALAIAAREGGLHRNFQGYTTDGAPVRLGFGPSAIGTLPRGYVQNAAPMHAYRDAVEAGQLPIARGLVLDDDDRLRAAVIERLMCDLRVDLGQVCKDFGRDPGVFAAELAGLSALEADGLVELDDKIIRVTEQGRPFVRVVCAGFDSHVRIGEERAVLAV
ncbi:MAG: oxygen-independent coproporphyrinogen III oxidase, partial [Planctomycetes bacterium]|nr:oxygen-independent coproporphyrinogen III oxidase [Planctomycetota bacterium]